MITRSLFLVFRREAVALSRTACKGSGSKDNNEWINFLTKRVVLNWDLWSLRQKQSLKWKFWIYKYIMRVSMGITVSRKSHYPIETLIKEFLNWRQWSVVGQWKAAPEKGKRTCRRWTKDGQRTIHKSMFLHCCMNCKKKKFLSRSYPVAKLTISCFFVFRKVCYWNIQNVFHDTCGPF